MKINIYYDFKNGPWGGGNQFLKALKNSLKDKKVYAESVEEADVVIVNSHHLGTETELANFFKIFIDQPKKIIIHRIDGPVGKIRHYDRKTDNLIFQFNSTFASGSIFQSKWCMDHCMKLGLDVDHNQHSIIFNAPNSNIFYPPANEKKDKEEKIKIIATSWSSNIRKGFDVYNWIDQNLNFDRYDMTFVGNSPIKFTNISHIKPLNSSDLAEQLRKHDIFLTASRSDPCSNSLIEALHTGLPALVFRDGGHPELIGDGGLTFDSVGEIPEKLAYLSRNLPDFSKKIMMPTMDEITSQYITFAQKCSNIKEHNFYQSKLDSFQNLYKKYQKKSTFSLMRNKIVETMLQYKANKL